MNKIKEIGEQDFQREVLESEVPVLVDFWAPWCGPCRMVTPVLEAVAEKMNGKFKFVKVNTDENPEAAMGHQISAIPSLIVFKKGIEVDRIIGFKPQNMLEQQLQTYVES